MAKPLSLSSDDAELVDALRNDRSDLAFGALYDRHTPRAFQTAWRILGGDSHLAEDAVQDAWVRAVANLGNWSRREAFGAWLRGIAAHVAIDILRRERRLDFSDDVDTLALAQTPMRDVELIDLESAIAALAPGYRAVLVLHDVEGFTHEEIAEQLGITSGTSKGQLFKARRAVRARLATRAAGTTEKA